MGLTVAGEQGNSFKKWWTTISLKCKVEGRMDIMEYMGSTMWYLWKERNNNIFKDKIEIDARTANNRLKLLLEAEMANPEGSAHRWEKPEPGFIKVNVDAAFWATTNSGAIGIVGRRLR
ncbi:hypothetical protein LIER_08636 [Lithospermum erythrorhizon]|uniref:RNase H type-1 domain-containing protein n=1 Tax=Lithospermum erythrorhizon TaxID=34254 RepID=A0AAV3PEV8_LITER